jgi:hypothetical protein
VGPIFPVWCQLTEPSTTIVLAPERLSLGPFSVDRAAIQCDLDADLSESGRGLECVFAHRAALFEARTVSALMVDYDAILRLMAGEPRLQVSDLCGRACTIS